MKLCCSILLVIAIIFLQTSCSAALVNNNNFCNKITSRREAAKIVVSSPLAVGATTIHPCPANANGLAAKLSTRDPAVLKNSVFNIPPSAQVYPSFMRGDWEISLSFAGYIFPSKTISKDKIVSNANIPGFQKCSIISVSDIGKEEVTYRMKIAKDTGLEDRRVTLESCINSHLGYKAIRDVLYDPSSNANRISIDFVPNRTRNANRVELFCNARESELVRNPSSAAASGDDGSLSIFVNSEYIRQVTFGLSQEFGVARQIVGNYAHFWTWREQLEGNRMTGNLLTAVYLDPQDALFFDEPSKPVAVYSHQIIANRVD
mmetsp:Transcript_4825/g.9204  ORF Transcript_4825/g.9204 Transcript_4825/m.9204 type:complete len:318 (-) Transcript_4825:286-1239(-)